MAFLLTDLGNLDWEKEMIDYDYMIEAGSDVSRRGVTAKDILRRFLIYIREELFLFNTEL
jgi:hypothetical protein